MVVTACVIVAELLLYAIELYEFNIFFELPMEAYLSCQKLRKKDNDFSLDFFLTANEPEIIKKLDLYNLHITGYTFAPWYNDEESHLEQLKIIHQLLFFDCSICDTSLKNYIILL